MRSKTLSVDESLLEIARKFCQQEGINFDSLGPQRQRGLVRFWCPGCKQTLPLTELTIARKKKMCTRCNSGLKLYSTSNKFGEVRRSIFFAYLSMTKGEDR